MEDSADAAVPRSAAARRRRANVPTPGAHGRDLTRGIASHLVPVTEAETASARRSPEHFEQFSGYGTHAALAACLFGFAWAASTYYSAHYAPFYTLTPPQAQNAAAQESVAPAEMLRTAQNMAKDITALKAGVEALRAA
ncbi:MAG: hypothetical protein ACT4O2_00240, partial [Beijerinckiaceae bacterium]